MNIVVKSFSIPKPMCTFLRTPLTPTHQNDVPLPLYGMRDTVYGTSSTAYSLQTTVYSLQVYVVALLLSGNCGSGIPFPSEEEEALESGGTKTVHQESGRTVIVVVTRCRLEPNLCNGALLEDDSCKAHSLREENRYQGELLGPKCRFSVRIRKADDVR